MPLPRRNATECKHTERNHHARGLCKECYRKHYVAQNESKVREYASSYHRQNKASRSKYGREYYQRTKHARDRAYDSKKNYEQKLFRAYGITPQEYSERLRDQGGVCATCKCVCATGRRLAVDHDHKTGAVRGLLCAKCNNGLGYFNDDIELLRNAIEYLERHHEQQRERTRPKAARADIQSLRRRAGGTSTDQCSAI